MTDGSVPPDILEHIARAVASVRYGVVEITIHDSCVVQIEKAEKIRLARPSHLTTGASPQQRSHGDQAAGGAR